VSESLRDIRIFVAAYEEGSFTAAAAREHVTQSGVSQHIRKLEEVFKVTLFSRDKGHVNPTPAADAYYVRCIDILRGIEFGKTALRAFAGVSGEISIGLMPSMTRRTLAPAIQRLASEHPNIRLRVTESFSPILTQKVLSADLDFAVVPAFGGGRGLKVRNFLRTWETLVAAPSESLHLKRMRLRDFGPLKLVVPSHTNARRKPLEAYFSTNGVLIERIIEMDSMMGTLDLVANSDWVAVIPALMMTAELSAMQFSVIPIVDPAITLDLVVIEPMRRALSEAARTFLEILRAESTFQNNLWKSFFSNSRPSC
jgi:LysR family transcriptional regulator, nitrogen assimilation regulatory protein